MKKSKIYIVLIGIILIQCQTKTVLESDLILRGGTIINCTGSDLQSDKDIFIKDGKILKISEIDQFDYTDNTKIIDLKGKFIIPGLIEMHAHIPPDTTIQEEVLLTYLSFGITTILNPMASHLNGIGLKQKVDSNQFLGPKLFTAGKGIIGPSKFGGFSFFQSIKSEEEAKEEVLKQVNEGVDFIKVHAHIPAELMKIVIEEAHKNDKKVIGHLGQTSWTEAAELGIDVIVHSSMWGPTWELVPDEHQEKFKSNYIPSKNWPNDYDATLYNDWINLVNYNDNKSQRLLSILKENEVIVEPNLVVVESIIFGNQSETKDRLKLEYAPQKLRSLWTSDINPSVSFWSEDDFIAVQKAWPKFLEFIQVLHQKGITITVGSDLGNAWITPGIGFHRELELLVQVGISPLEVLKMATINGAKVLGVSDEIGTIEDGKIANLVILDADPIENISNTKRINKVVYEGELFSQEELGNMIRSNSEGM